MAPARTSCMAMVTGLWAIVSTRARAPRCSCLQRSPATEMNSNLLPMFSVEIMEPPLTRLADVRARILDEKPVADRAGRDRGPGGARPRQAFRGFQRNHAE